MYRKSSHRPLVRLAAIGLMFAVVSGPRAAGAADTDEVDRLVTAAETALGQQRFREAAEEYRKAALLSDDADVAKQATRISYSYGFNDDALIAAERWLKLDPDDDEALLYVAQLKLRMGDVKASARNFENLLKRGDEPADERLISLIPLLSQEDAKDADAVMRRLAKPYKDSAYAHYAAGVMALQAGDAREAGKRAQRAIDLDSEWLKPKLLYARSLLLDGDEDGAINYVSRIIGDDPDPDPDARLELAIMLLSAGRDDDALSQVNQVLLEQPSRADALRLMAIINFRAENLDAARDDFEDLLASGRYTMDAFYYLARIADYREEWDKAVGLYSQVTTGTNAVVSQRRASFILAEQGEAETAFEHLQKFGDTHPAQAVDMILAQAQLAAYLERYDEALQYYDKVIRFRPDSEEVVLGKAELLLRMGQLDDSIHLYRKAVERWPDSAMSLNALGYTLADRTERYSEAARLIKKALEIEPESAAIIDSHGWVLYRQGKLDEALGELERAYEKLKDPEVAAHIVEVLWKLGREDEARQTLADAEEQFPDNKLLKDVRERAFPES